MLFSRSDVEVIERCEELPSVALACGTNKFLVRQESVCDGSVIKVLYACDRHIVHCVLLFRFDYSCFLWPPYVIGGPLYFCTVVSFYLSSSFFFPRLISAVAEWMSTILLVLDILWP